MKFGPVAIAILIFLWPGPAKSFNYENLCQIYMTVMQSQYGVTPNVDDYLECLRDPGKWRSRFLAEHAGRSSGGRGGGGGGGGGIAASKSQHTADDAALAMCQNKVTRADQFAGSSYFNFMDMSVIRDGAVSIVSGRADVMNKSGQLQAHSFTCDVEGNQVVDLRVRGGS